MRPTIDESEVLTNSSLTNVDVVCFGVMCISSLAKEGLTSLERRIRTVPNARGQPLFAGHRNVEEGSGHSPLHQLVLVFFVALVTASAAVFRCFLLAHPAAYGRLLQQLIL